MKVSKKRKIWLEENKEYLQKYKHDWNIKNKERISVMRKEYREKNKETIAEKEKLYYMNPVNKKKRSTRGLSWIVRRTNKVYELLGNKCARCEFDNPAALQIHHKYGKEKGADWLKLDYDLTKLEVLCANCHCVEHYEGKIRNGRNGKSAEQPTH